MKAILSKGKKQLAKPPQGKQSLKQLMKQNAGVSNIEITEGNIKAFESTAKKYGIDFALKKDATESPPRYLVFFKGRDADVLTAAFKEFSAKKLTQEQKDYLWHGPREKVCIDSFFKMLEENQYKIQYRVRGVFLRNKRKCTYSK